RRPVLSSCPSLAPEGDAPMNAGRRRFARLALFLAVVVPTSMMVVLAPVGAEVGIGCAPTGLGTESVTSDKADYSPEQTVHLAGAGYSPGCDVVVKVTRPDGSVVIGDGSFTDGSDTVTTADDGS